MAEVLRLREAARLIGVSPAAVAPRRWPAHGGARWRSRQADAGEPGGPADVLPERRPARA